jgi:hypothetical protein
MAIPSGGGTEVLKRTNIHAQSSSETSFRWDGTQATTGTASYTVPANHIITVLSVIMSNEGSDTELITMKSNVPDNSSGRWDIFLLQNQSIATKETFIWSDKFILGAGDYLVVNCGSTANIDFHLSFIDQDFS